MPAICYTTSGVVILAGSAVLFALGSVLLARPFVRSLATLLVAVPLAAVVGVLLLGALAVVVAVLVALFWLDADVPTGSGGRKRRSRAVK